MNKKFSNHLVAIKATKGYKVVFGLIHTLDRLKIGSGKRTGPTTKINFGKYYTSRIIDEI